MKKQKYYIYTECFFCAEILRPCLISFFKYHPDEIVHVFGTPKDFKELGKFDNVEYVDMSNDGIIEGFKDGHWGTGMSAAKAIQKYIPESGAEIGLHFDSDIIFRDECISLLTNEIDNGADLVGPVRLYLKNLNSISNLNFSDVTQTYFYAFNIKKIDNFDFHTLARMCTGIYNPLGHQILDFWDPVAFNILKNKVSIKFLDKDEVGGLSMEGNRINKYVEQNSDMDFGSKLIHWAGCGTGSKVYRHGYDNINRGYAEWALKRFGLFSLLVLNKKTRQLRLYRPGNREKIQLSETLFSRQSNYLIFKISKSNTI